ncbi:MAG: reverse transcriptase family protein, partial [Gammaproteobacteria bacterium]|nr:reverse transcriptase family protein [Gammaproteobacteria bacterium]
NRCLHEGEFPRIWKHARISPIPKVPGTNPVNEFRPISVLPVLSKIAEKWLKRILRPFIMDRIDPNQFAYAAGRSTEDAINLLQFYATCGFEICPNTTKVALVSFDIKKAFDQVQKNRLLLILRSQFQLPDALASLLDSYLSDRMQTVVVGAARSDSIAAMSGVAQGSILGPHLFSAFITSVLNLQLSKNARLIGYADDIILVKPIASPNDCLHLQDDIDKILAEYTKLHLQLNPAKTSFLLATLSPDPSQVKLDIVPRLAGEEIEQKSTIQYLGVELDHKFDFGPHTELRAAKAKRAIGALWRILGKWTTRRNFCEIYTKKIMPLFCYALPVACPTSQRHWTVLEKVHRFAARLVTNNFISSYTDILEFLHWKPISRLCAERQLLLMFKYLEGLRYLPDGVMCMAEPPTRRSRPYNHLFEFEFDFDFDLDFDHYR